MILANKRFVLNKKNFIFTLERVFKSYAGSRILLLAVTAMVTAMNVNAQTKELTSADEEVIQLRECRVGNHNPQFTPPPLPVVGKR